MPVNTCNNFSEDIEQWAYINFRLQVMISKEVPSISQTMRRELKTIGYEGISLDYLNAVQKEELLSKDAFFGYLQTGHRIIAYVLKINGLNREMFNSIHESIENAYKKAIEKNGQHELIETSYQYALQTLAVFRP